MNQRRRNAALCKSSLFRYGNEGKSGISKCASLEPRTDVLSLLYVCHQNKDGGFVFLILQSDGIVLPHQSQGSQTLERKLSGADLRLVCLKVHT